MHTSTQRRRGRLRRCYWLCRFPCWRCCCSCGFRWLSCCSFHLTYCCLCNRQYSSRISCIQGVHFALFEVLVFVHLFLTVSSVVHLLPFVAVRIWDCQLNIQYDITSFSSCILWSSCRLREHSSSLIVNATLSEREGECGSNLVWHFLFLALQVPQKVVLVASLLLLQFVSNQLWFFRILCLAFSLFNSSMAARCDEHDSVPSVPFQLNSCYVSYL